MLGLPHPPQKLFNAYCNKMGQDQDHLRFLIDGEARNCQGWWGPRQQSWQAAGGTWVQLAWGGSSLTSQVTTARATRPALRARSVGASGTAGCSPAAITEDGNEKGGIASP